ncbi:PilZ domain-containing protein [Sphingomonas sp. RS2018]
MAYDNLAYAELRRDVRDDVHHRARAIMANGEWLQLVVVNVSAGGFMARCDSELTPGDALRITLPAIGARLAEVKWALGGRIGCAFERAVPPPDYRRMLGTISR